ncbi:recombinase family protein [Arthrobacter pityocampae]|uniref:recombinase family protein n=1 Tax=Arthrobacter pityocampae TaxID=547334 RepID=UPI0037356441
MTGQRVGYVRVSTLDQKTVRQLDGVVLDRVFTDHASGKDQNRPALEDLIGFVRDGDTVVVHSMDRLARNLEDLRSIVRRLTGKKVRVEFVHENLLFTGEDNAMATLLLNVTGAFAEFERSLIRERQREGIVLAKQRNAYKGRAPSLSPDQAAELCRKADAGVPKAALAREFGISRETVYTYLRARTNEAAAATALMEEALQGLPMDTRPPPTLTTYDTLLTPPQPQTPPT